MHDDDRRDPGLAAERTQLAWNRSGLAVIVCIAVLLRRLWPLRGTNQVIALAAIAAAAMVWAAAMLVARVHMRPGSTPHTTGVRTFRLITAGTVSLALGAAILTLVTPA